MIKILIKLQQIDRRIIYILLAAVIAVPLIIRPGKHPQIIFPEVQKSYNILNNIPKDKIVLISTIWGPETMSENGPQTEAIMRHLFKSGTGFVLISWNQAGSEITYQMGKKLEKEMGKKYGKDWVHLGYKVPYLDVVLRGMSGDFQKVMGHDKFGTKLSEIPLTKNVKTHAQIGAVVEVTPVASLEAWIAYYCGPNKIPLIYCPAAVMAAEAYPYLDSGQVSGMVNGVVGAAQYEKLLGMDNVRTDAAATCWALSAAHILIIILIILGNIGYLATKRSGSKYGGKKLG